MPSGLVLFERAKDVENALGENGGGHHPKGDLDKEIARIAAILTRRESAQAADNRGLARDQHEQRPWQKPERAACPIEQLPSPRGIALREKIDGKMRAGARCRRDADRNEQRERDLS